MKQIVFILLLFAVAVQSYAQPHYHTQAKACVTDEGVTLRWAPMDMQSWQAAKTHGYHFLEQFSKDFANRKVSDLSQLKWIFDGKKVPADFKSKMLNEIKKIKMGNEVLSKFHYANEEELYKAISKKFDGIFIIANE